MSGGLFDPGRNCLAVAPARSGVIVDACAYYRAVADALERAERFVLLTGWQLDSRVVLRRLPHERPEDHSLAAILGRACRRSPRLVVKVLPWDWNPVYATDREWATAEKLEQIADGRVQCVWDSAHPPGASQHEKMVLVDGHTAWIGGIDLCDSRWDDRKHLPDDPRRVDLSGKPFGPYHDVQAVVRGPAVRHLMDVFADRWARAGGEPWTLEPAPEPPEPPIVHYPLACAEVAIARTRPVDPRDRRPEIREIEALLVDAIASAERLIYVETQYLTSRTLLDALVRRMESAGPRLEIVLILPRRCEGILEGAAVSGPQLAGLHLLSDVARARGHALGVFCPASRPTAAHAESDDAPPITYVHSKLVSVDDRFLTIGSANLTNRSMGVDSELNVAWACGDHASRASIRALRLALLAEHIALPERDAERVLSGDEPLVPKLEWIAAMPSSQLVAHSYVDRPAVRRKIDELLAEIGDPAHAESFAERADAVLERATEALGLPRVPDRGVPP